jgi:hypothetical protein
MAKKRRVKCPYCGERSEERTRSNGETRSNLYHKSKCVLALAVDPESRVKDCPKEMLGIYHGSFVAMDI